MSDRPIVPRSATPVVMVEVERMYKRIDGTEHTVTWQANQDAAEYARQAIAIPSEEQTKQERTISGRTWLVGGLAAFAMVLIYNKPEIATHVLVALALTAGVVGVGVVVRIIVNLVSGKKAPENQAPRLPRPVKHKRT